MAGRSLKNIQVNGNKDSETCGEGVWGGRYSMALQREPGRNSATAKRYKPMNVGCWNVRTLFNNKVNINRPERRSALEAKELGCYSMDIVALSETRLAEKSNFMEETGAYTFF